MIQRKQTLFMLAVTALMAVVLFANLAIVTGPATAVLDVWGLSFSNGESQKLIYFGIITLAATLLPFVTLFLFKKRTLQLRLCYVESIVLAGVIIFEAIYGYMLYTSGYAVDFSIIMLLPIFCLPLVYMARKGIMADISLLKSYDRIR